MNYPYYILSRGNWQISQPKNGEEPIFLVAIIAVEEGKFR